MTDNALDLKQVLLPTLQNFYLKWKGGGDANEPQIITCKDHPASSLLESCKIKTNVLQYMDYVF